MGPTTDSIGGSLSVGGDINDPLTAGALTIHIMPWYDSTLDLTPGVSCPGLMRFTSTVGAHVRVRS